MSGVGHGNRNWRSGLETAATLFAKYTLSIIGAVLTISGFVALVTANSARLFVKQHPYPIYLALIVAVLVIMATLNYIYALRKRTAQLESVLDHPEPLRPSAHDVRFYDEVLSDIPVDGRVITWLKRTEMAELSVNDFPADVLSALEKTVERPRIRPVGFDDQEAAVAFRALTGAIEDFRAAVEHSTFAQHNARWRGGTGGTGGTAERSPIAAEDPSAMTRALVSCHEKLIQAYDAFIVTTHARGIDADPPNRSAGRSE
jgi:hypothetical protein